MLPPESTNLTALMWLSAGAGVLHTLAGPDHYAPLIAVGRARDWGARRAAVVAATLGLAHCLFSVTIAVALVMLAVARMPAWLDGLSPVAAWTMIAAGIALGIRSWRRRGDHRARADRPSLTLLSLAFFVGPCEWLIPFACAAGAMHGALAAVQVGAVYTVCTVATMVAATLVGLFGLRRLVAVRRGDWLAAITTTACGTLMLTGM